MVALGVSVAAVQAQLQAMGHTIPDSTIEAFLHAGPAGPPCEQARVPTGVMRQLMMAGPLCKLVCCRLVGEG